MGFLSGAADLAKQWTGGDSPIGKNLGANSSIGSSLRKPPAAMAPIATLPSWLQSGAPGGTGTRPSWMPNFGQQATPSDGGFAQMMQRLFGPRQS